MDLRAYYQKLREVEKGIEGEFVVIRSLVTPDGGVAGRLTEVSRPVAARMIVDGLAELAGPQEAEGYRKRAAEEHRLEQERRASTQFQFAVVPEAELRALRRPARVNPKG